MSQRVFITGGASGLGLALAKRWIKDGAKVCIADVNDERGEEALKELGENAHYVHCDVTREEDMQRAAADLESRWGGVDIVVNNAGVATAGAIEEETLEQWQWVININLLGVVRGCKAFTPMFKRARAGTFLNVASMAGLTHPPMMSSYNVCKAGVVALSETLAVELAPYNVQVAVACPSFFKTHLDETMRSTRPEAKDMVRHLFAKGKLSADDVADFCVRGVGKGDFYLLPHSDGRSAFRAKRWLPARSYLNLMEKRTRRMRNG